MRGEIITREEMLAIPAIEISDLGRMPSDPLVSVLVITYNQEAFIGQTIQGILNQQCDFPIEVIIGEDKSQDRTLEICLEYQRKYPEIIRIVTWRENIGSNANLLRVWGRARGKYVGSCEGDDYWIDPDKLAKQVALMEQYPDTILSGALVRTQDENKGEFDGCIFGPIKMKNQYELEDVLIRQCFHTSTFLFRRAGFKIPACARNVFCMDTVIVASAALQGSLRCLPDTVAVWRLHAGGIMSGLERERQEEKLIEILRSIRTFVDERYLPIINKREDIMCASLCHVLASSGQLARARRLARERVWGLAQHAPKKAIGLVLHAFFPRTFLLVAHVWTRGKHLLNHRLP